MEAGPPQLMAPDYHALGSSPSSLPTDSHRFPDPWPEERLLRCWVRQAPSCWKGLRCQALGPETRPALPLTSVLMQFIH